MKKIIQLMVIMSLMTWIIAGCANKGKIQDATETTKEVEKEAEKETKTKETEETETKDTVAEQEDANDSSWPRTIKDGAGNEILLEKKPERITLLHTFYMEHFFVLGVPITAAALGNALGHVEALDESELYAPYLKDLDIMNLGSAMEINLEAILESDPDVMVVFNYNKMTESYDQLTQIAPLALLNHRDTWQNQLVSCAEIVGEEDKVDAVIEDIEAVIADAKKELEHYTDRTFALFRTNGKGFIPVATEAYYETFGISIPKGYPFDYSAMSLEAVAEMDPYYMVFQHNYEQSKAFVDSFENSTVWQSLDAVKNGRIYYFDENMNTFGPLAMKLTAEKLMKIYTE